MKYYNVGNTCKKINNKKNVMLHWDKHSQVLKCSQSEYYVISSWEKKIINCRIAFQNDL